jgi:hypothetical protein
VVSRAQIAEHGPAQEDLDALFGSLRPDPEDALDAVLDRGNMPLDEEPPSVVAELESVRRRSSSA